jgi:guanylate kinase
MSEEMKPTGTLVLVVGVTGSGKGALMDAARRAFPNAVFPRSWTTRLPRPGEIEGKSFFFVDAAAFERACAEGAFLEAAVYGGHRYGTLAEEILPALMAGKLVVREVDVQGARAIKVQIPAARIRTIFVHAGSWDSLVKRIRARAPMDDEELARRYARYADEMAFEAEADAVVLNCDGELAAAEQQFISAIREVTA